MSGWEWQSLMTPHIRKTITWDSTKETVRFFCLSAWNGDQDGWSLNIIFDTDTQVVFIVESCDYKRKRAYRLINSEYRKAYFEYANKQNCNYINKAWDDIDYIDLELSEDWLEKTSKIVADEDYDTRVSIPLELSDSELFKLMTMAHEKDISLNQFVTEVLQNFVDNNT